MIAANTNVTRLAVIAIQFAGRRFGLRRNGHRASPAMLRRTIRSYFSLKTADKYEL